MSLSTTAKFYTSKRSFVLTSDIDAITALEDIANVLGAEKTDSFTWFFNSNIEMQDEQSLQVIEKLYKKVANSKLFELNVACEDNSFTINSEDSSSVTIVCEIISLFNVKITITEDRSKGFVVFTPEQKNLYQTAYDVSVKLGLLPF